MTTAATQRLTRAEFFKAVVQLGLRAALFLARELGVCLAQAQLWVRSMRSVLATR